MRGVQPAIGTALATGRWHNRLAIDEHAAGDTLDMRRAAALQDPDGPAAALRGVLYATLDGAAEIPVEMPAAQNVPGAAGP